MADWGWANTGFHRETPTPEVATPAIDAIVKDGVQLNRMYAYPYCGPSRAALMSGRMPRHSNPGNIRGASYDPNHTEVGGQGVPRNMTTVSQMLGKAGCVTMCGAVIMSAPCPLWQVHYRTSGRAHTRRTPTLQSPRTARG